jgi:hypothetical protein
VGQEREMKKAIREVTDGNMNGLIIDKFDDVPAKMKNYVILMFFHATM